MNDSDPTAEQHTHSDRKKLQRSVRFRLKGQRCHYPKHEKYIRLYIQNAKQAYISACLRNVVVFKKEKWGYFLLFFSAVQIMLLLNTFV